jgi:DNA-binding LacI/PurR family transcriptional regulator
MAKTTLATLAQTLGVSRSTVSNAFSRPDQLSAGLRDRILTAAAELGYEGPSTAAASLRTGRTDTLGVLFTDSLSYAFTDPVSACFLSGIAEAAEAAGLALTVVSSPRGMQRSALSKATLDGLIVYSVDENSPGLAVARRRAVPLVMVDQTPETQDTCVNITDRAGAAAALMHLVELGHRSLAVIAVAAGPKQCARVSPRASSVNHVVRERMAGWLDAVEAAALPDPAAVSCPTNSREHGRHAARLLLRAPEPPTGIVCLSDELALGVMDELAASGAVVPRDVSVVGFDDSPVARLASPALTTIRQPAREKGRIAAHELIALLAGGRPGTHRMLPTHLTVRDSSAPPRSVPTLALTSSPDAVSCGDASD